MLHNKRLDTGLNGAKGFCNMCLDHVGRLGSGCSAERNLRRKGEECKPGDMREGSLLIEVKREDQTYIKGYDTGYGLLKTWYQLYLMP
jgi:hypothetical protein